MYVQYV